MRSNRGVESTILEGLGQTEAYRNRCDAESGHLAVYDRNPEQPGSQRAFRRVERAGPMPIAARGL